MMKDREMKTQQWKAYVDGAKAAYLREKERHQAALNNSEKEIAAAKLAQDEARQAVIATIDRQSLPQAAQEEMEVEEEWDTMLEAWDQEQVEQFDGVLRRAMAERQLYQHPIITPQRPSHRAPRAPTVVTTEATHAPPRDGSATSEWCQLCFGFSGWTTSGTRSLHCCLASGLGTTSRRTKGPEFWQAITSASRPKSRWRPKTRHQSCYQRTASDSYPAREPGRQADEPSHGNGTFRNTSTAFQDLGTRASGSCSDSQYYRRRFRCRSHFARKCPAWAALTAYAGSSSSLWDPGKKVSTHPVGLGCAYSPSFKLSPGQNELFHVEVHDFRSSPCLSRFCTATYTTLCTMFVHMFESIRLFHAQQPVTCSLLFPYQDVQQQPSSRSCHFCNTHSCRGCDTQATKGIILWSEYHAASPCSISQPMQAPKRSIGGSGASACSMGLGVNRKQINAVEVLPQVPPQDTILFQHFVSHEHCTRCRCPTDMPGTHLDILHTELEAPKTSVGGSGASAPTSVYTSPWDVDFNPAIAFLEYLGSLLSAIGRTLAFLAGAASVGFLCKPGTRKASSLVRFLGFSLSFENRNMVAPLAVCASPCESSKLAVVLLPSRTRKTKPGGQSHKHRSWAFWVWVLYLFQPPSFVWAMHPVIPTGCLSSARLDSTQPGPSLEDDSLPSELPWPSAGQANELRLSAMIFAPHYHPLCVQIPVLPEDGPQDVIERAAEAASQGLHPDFTTVTPATGMPLENLALFVATPECLIESGRVVTFLDLSAVGGQTFACVLPDQIAFPDLVNFLVPLATTNHDSLEIFLEGSTVAASSDQSLALRSGSFIEVRPEGIPSPGCFTFDQVLRGLHDGVSPAILPAPPSTLGVCVCACFLGTNALC